VEERIRRRLLEAAALVEVLAASALVEALAAAGEELTRERREWGLGRYFRSRFFTGCLYTMDQ
jgi:hypothetical protein